MTLVLLSLLFAANDTVLEAVTVENPAGLTLATAKRVHLHFTGDRRQDFALNTVSKDPVQGKDSRASFVVDFDEPPVRALVEQIGAKPSPETLTAFVARYIEKKNRSRLLDAASIVAKRKEGDCTEHAVLLAALLRAFHMPSRVMIGVVLVQTGKEIQAFGHAWTERYDGKTWQLADAAIPTEMKRAYVPLSVLSEGPGAGASASVMNAVISLEKIVL